MTESNWLKRFNDEVLPRIKSDFKPETVLLFGSYITGKATEDSDIDVIIVSKTFENIRFLERMPLLIKKIRFPKHIDFICYTPSEFERIKNKSSILMDALKHGKFL